MKFLTTLCVAVALLSFVGAHVAVAATYTTGPSGTTYTTTSTPTTYTTGSNTSGGVTGFAKLQNPLKVDSIEKLLQLILQVLLIFAVPIIVFFIIYAGFLFVTAQGNEEQLKKAKNALLWTVIGGVIVLGANVILNVIVNTVNSLK